jgi:hypothetical protein
VVADADAQNAVVREQDDLRTGHLSMALMRMITARWLASS